ncbi:MAG: HipA domain-containing protein [Lachnospiraceae bacterium]|nr:HipA domain-containing protein [Lachnospiraceae bacterium]
MYTLKHYDTPLIDFEITDDKLNGQSCRIVRLFEAESMLLPTGLTPTDEGLMSWLKSRVIPKNREFVENFLAKNGLSRKDTKGIIDACMGLSLNDVYWVVDSDFTGLYKDYNLFEHDFVKALSLIAYTGYGSSRASGFTSSPEFTTAGMLRKGWRRLRGTIYLYKGGTSGAANTGNEPYSEFMASQLADRMGIKHVDYDLARWKGHVCSTCELFTDINNSYVPMYRFVGSKATLNQIADFLKSLGGEYYDAFADMMIFDALIFNEDRHLGNYGLMVANDTNKPVCFAPLFDHGLSLFNYAMADDLENISEYRKTRRTSNGASFDDVAAEFMSARQKKMLRRLIGFKFDKHPSYNLPGKRIKAIEDFLQKRVDELLNINA